MKTANSFPRLVHFFGPDGSGKSTQVNMLVDILRKRGVRVQKCWVRAHHTLAFVLWRLLVRIGFYRVVLNPFGVATKLPAVNRNRLLRGFWSAVEFIGVLPIILRVHYYLWRGRTLVAERYILDTVTTIAYFLDDINFLRSRTSKLLLRFIPKETAFIFLDADYNTIYKRRAPLFVKRIHLKRRRKNYGDIPRSSVEPRVFIEFQRTAYKALAKSFNPLLIDTSRQSVEETSMMILQYLETN